MLLPPTQPLSVQRPSTPLPPTQPQPKPLSHVLANTRAIQIRATSSPLVLFPGRILRPGKPLARRRPATTPQLLPPQCPATPQLRHPVTPRSLRRQLHSQLHSQPFTQRTLSRLCLSQCLLDLRILAR